MEFPHLGQHCNEDTCKQLDFLPMKCDACSKIYCCDHIVYVNHKCPESYKKDNQIPVCPLCNLPCPLLKGEVPDVVVGRHIESDCQSDPAKERRKVYINKCSKKGCKQKELIPVKCETCHLNFCLRHRHEQDHECKGFQGSGKAINKSGASAILRSQQASPSSSSSKISPTPVASSSSRTQTGNVNGNSINARIGNQANLSSLQGSMSEDEALARALQMSVTSQNPNDGMTDQEREDFLLAQALAASEQEAAAARQRSQQSRPQRCAVQ